MSSLISIVPDAAHFDEAVEALYARAFGPGRFAKAAAKLREANICVREKSFVAVADQQMVGACRMWPVVGQSGARALFLGPIAVAVGSQGQGLGQRLLEACIEASAEETIILVGDIDFFGHHGFEVVPKNMVILPRPVAPARLLWRLRDPQRPVMFGGLAPLVHM